MEYLTQEERSDLRIDDLREDSEQADRSEIELLERNMVIVGEWNGEPIIRPMTVAERYFKNLHIQDEDHDHKETCTCNA